MKRFELLILIFFIWLLTVSFSLMAGETDSAGTCKKRLPEQVNRTQPVIVPVLTLDGNRLYFDRKEHPRNTGGYRDQDEIWYSDKNGKSWTEPKHPQGLNSAQSDVIFTIMPDGQKALAYGSFNAGIRPGFCLLEKAGSKWSFLNKLDIKKFYNNSDFFHGYLSSDGKKLLLSIEREDSRGGHDLYISFYHTESNTWSEPENMGDILNTGGLETAPFLAYDDRTLYFASDGHGGEGKLDLFISRRLDDTWKNWSDPVNLGKEINTYEDERGIWLTALGDSAYIVSWDSVSRRAGFYYVCIPKEFRPGFYAIIKGQILYDQDGIRKAFDKKANISTGEMRPGNSFFKSNPADGSYIIVDNNPDDGIGANAYHPQYGFAESESEIHINNRTKPCFVEETMVYEIEIFIREPLIILFDYDSARLDKSAIERIREWAGKDFPDGRQVRIAGYADSSGTESYNKSLSMKRAVKVAEQMILQGIDKRMIRIEAKGESEPRSEDPAENRRVEIELAD